MKKTTKIVARISFNREDIRMKKFRKIITSMCLTAGLLVAPLASFSIQSQAAAVSPTEKVYGDFTYTVNEDKNEEKTSSEIKVSDLISSDNISDIVEQDKNKELVVDKELWNNNISKIKENKFPIELNSKEWKNLKNHDEMVKKCTIPKGILKELSTKNLLEMVMNYPLLVDLYSYSSVAEGIRAVINDFNGMQELIARPDLPKELISCYEKVKVPQKFKLKSSNIRLINEGNSVDNIIEKIIDKNADIKEIHNDFKCISKIDILEFLITNEYFWEKFDEEDKSRIFSELRNKNNQKKDSEFYAIDNSNVHSYIDNYRLDEYLGVEMMSAVAQLYVKTPKGSKVPVQSYAYKGSAWANELDVEFKRAYPNAVLLRSSDNRYNCHSYEWYSTNLGNFYWMNNPQKYFGDGSYKEVTNKSKRASGNRIVWVQYPLNNPFLHSGYLAAINKDGSYKVYSKWGQGPLMQHKAGYSPYNGTRVDYKKA